MSERRTEIARRNELLPLFPIEKRITPVDAYGILTQEQAARADVVWEIEQIFTQYAVSLHAQLGDLLSHPDELIYRDNRYLTFAQASDEPGYSHYVGLEQQKSKVGGQEAITCKSAVHFLAPSTALSEVSEHPLTCTIGQGAITPYFARIWLPKHYRDISIFEFDGSGRVLGLFNEENRGFFRLPVTLALPTRTTNIQHEVATALAKLPMNPTDETPKAVEPGTRPSALVSSPTPRIIVSKVLNYLKSVSGR